MTFKDLRPLTITLYLSLVITIPLSILMGILGVMGLYIEIPLFFIFLIFSCVYIYQLIKNKKLHFIVFYPFILVIFFLAGYVYDMNITDNTIASLKSYGKIVESYYDKNKKLPNKEEYDRLGIDKNCIINIINDETFEINYRDGIYNNYDHVVRLRPRP